MRATCPVHVILTGFDALQNVIFSSLFHYFISLTSEYPLSILFLLLS
jgi:hypothetical protein